MPTAAPLRAGRLSRGITELEHSPGRRRLDAIAFGGALLTLIVALYTLAGLAVWGLWRLL